MQIFSEEIFYRDVYMTVLDVLGISRARDASAADAQEIAAGTLTRLTRAHRRLTPDTSRSQALPGTARPRGSASRQAAEPEGRQSLPALRSQAEPGTQGHRAASFPGSAWERTAREALPRAWR